MRLGFSWEFQQDGGPFQRKDGSWTFIKYETAGQRHYGIKSQKKVLDIAIKRILHYRISPHPMLQPVTDKLIKPRGTTRSGMEREIKKQTGLEAKIK